MMYSHDDSEAPNVAPLVVVVRVVVQESVDHLGRHVLRAPHRRRHLRRLRSVLVVVAVGARRQVEVADLDRGHLIVGFTQNVSRFEVTMSDSVVVEIRNRRCYVLDHLRGFNFVKMKAVFNSMQQGTSVHFLKNQVEVVFSFKVFDELQDIGAVGAFVQQLYFFENTNSAVAINVLVNNLILFVSELVSASLHSGVRALAQLFLTHIVQVVEGSSAETVACPRPALLAAPLASFHLSLVKLGNIDFNGTTSSRVVLSSFFLVYDVFQQIGGRNQTSRSF